MKRIISILLALTMMFSMTASALATGFDYSALKGTYVLKNGDSGSRVKRLQQALIDWGYLPKGSADGAYGDRTEAAVKEFQRKNGFAGEVGYAGVATMFTQAALFGYDAYGANSSYRLSNNATGDYTIYSCNLKYSTFLDASFNFVNEDSNKTVEAICVYWWMADKNNNLVKIDGYNYWMSWRYGWSLGPGQSKVVTSSIDPKSSELNKACSLRFIIGEIAYTTGEVCVLFNASKEPYRNANYICGTW